MPLITWNEIYRTGIPRIDEQHETLFDAVNAFHAGLVSGVTKDELTRVLASIEAHAVEHFNTEEEFMRLHGFTEVEAHQSEHLLLLEEVKDFADRWAHDPAEARPTVVARFLGDWLTRHIQHNDFQYVKFLKEKGIVPG